MNTIKKKAVVVSGNGAGDSARRSRIIFDEEVSKTKAVPSNPLDWIVVNTERDSLERQANEINATKRLLLGPQICKGDGAAYDQSLGSQAFQESKTEFAKLFTNENGECEYDGVLVSHTTPKGTGGGTALPIGLFLRDELGIESVMFQSIRPSAGEVSVTQRRRADGVVDSLLQAGFNVIEIDNQAAYNRSPKHYLLDDTYRMLDEPTAGAMLAWLYVLSNPGSADRSDLKRWILNPAQGKRLMVSYRSFKKDVEDPTTEFREGLKKAFSDTWPCRFEKPRSIHEALVVYYGNSYWNTGRIETLQKSVQRFVDKYAGGSTEEFHPIYGRQDFTAIDESEYAFLAMMFCGPDEKDPEFQTLLKDRVFEAVAPKTRSPRTPRVSVPRIDPPQELPAIMSSSEINPEPPAPEVTTVSSEEPVAVNERDQEEQPIPQPAIELANLPVILKGQQDFLSEQLASKLTKAAETARQQINAFDIEGFISSEPNLELTPSDIAYACSDQLLALFAPAGKFEPVLAVSLVTSKSKTLKDTTTPGEITGWAKSLDSWDARSQRLVKERLAYFELFPEELVLRHLSSPRKTSKTTLPAVSAKTTSTSKVGDSEAKTGNGKTPVRSIFDPRGWFRGSPNDSERNISAH